MPIIPADDWLIEFQAPDGTNGRFYGPPAAKENGDPVDHHNDLLALADRIKVAHFDDLRWTNSPEDDPLDATWLGGAEEPIQVNPNDLIRIWTKGTILGEWGDRYYPRFMGEVIEPINPNAVGTAQIMRAIGIRETFYRADTAREGPAPRVPPGLDVSEAAERGLENTFMPHGLYRPDFIRIGITMTAASTPGGTSAGEWMDGIVTWAQQAGETIKWGINLLTNQLFLSQPTHRWIAADAREPGTNVEWQTPQAHDVIHRVRWLIAEGNLPTGIHGSAEQNLDAPDALTFLTESPDAPIAGRKTVALTPSESHRPLVALHTSSGTFGGMSYSIANDVSGSRRSFVGTNQDYSFQIGRVSDDDTTSYISLLSPTPGIMPVGSAIITKQVRLGLHLPSGTWTRKNVVGLSLNARVDPDSAGAVNATGPMEIEFMMHDGATTAGAGHKTSADGEADLFLLSGDRARYAQNPDQIISGGNYVYVWLTQRVTITEDSNEHEIRFAIQDFRAWVLDEAHLAAAAKQEYRLPQQDAATVTLSGLQVNAGEIDVTREDGVTLLGLPVEAITRRYHHHEGITTAYHVGSRIDPATAQAMDLVKDRDRRAIITARLRQALERRLDRS